MPLYTDHGLAQSVRRHLAGASGVEDARISISADGGVVTLRGYVDSLVDWHDAEETSRGVYGVCAVINELNFRRRVRSRVA